MRQLDQLYHAMLFAYVGPDFELRQIAFCFYHYDARFILSTIIHHDITRNSTTQTTFGPCFIQLEMRLIGLAGIIGQCFTHGTFNDAIFKSGITNLNGIGQLSHDLS